MKESVITILHRILKPPITPQIDVSQEKITAHNMQKTYSDEELYDWMLPRDTEGNITRDYSKKTYY